MKRSGSGFTIVELLIVIVVIAILAAITLISYNGIVNRAKSAEVLSRVDAYTKAIRLYQAQNSAFPPITQAETGSLTTACIGTASDYPATANLASGQCYKEGAATASTSATLNTQLSAFIGSAPKGSTDSVVSTDSNTRVRGLLYSNYGTSALLQYFQTGSNQQCGRGNASSDLTGYPGLTLCIITL